MEIGRRPRSSNVIYFAQATKIFHANLFANFEFHANRAISLLMPLHMVGCVLCVVHYSPMPPGERI